MGYDGSITIGTKIDQKGFKTGRKEIETGLNSMKNSLKGMAVAVGAAFSLKAIIDFDKELSQVALSAEASTQRIEDIFGSAGDTITDFAENNAYALGMSERAAKQYAATYGNLFSTYMSSQKDNAEITKAYLNSTAVVASKTGRTVNDVAERIRSGILGNTEAIEDLGINVNIKTIEITDAFKRIANGRSWDQLNAYEQAQVRMLSILEQSTNKYGTAVANNGTFATQQAAAAYDNLKQTLGELLNVAVIPAVKWFTQLLNTVNQFAVALFGQQAKKQQDVAKTANSAAKAQKTLAKETKEAAKAAKRSLAAFDELNVLTDQTSKNSENTQDGSNLISFDPNDYAGGALSGTIGENIKISPKIQEFADKIKKTLKDFSPLLKGIAAGFATAFAFNFVPTAVSKFAKMLGISNTVGIIKDAFGMAKITFQQTGKPLKSLNDGFKTIRMSLTNTQKAMIGAGGAVAAFVTVKESVKAVELGTMSAGQALMNIVPVLAVVGVALYAALGPWGLLLGAVAAVGGALVGFNDAQNELQAEFIREDFFDGIGTTIDTFTLQIENAGEKTYEQVSKINSLGDSVKSNNDKLSDCRIELDKYQTILSSTGSLTTEQATSMENNFKSLVSTIKDNFGYNADMVFLAFGKASEGAAKDLGYDVGEMTRILEGFKKTFGDKTQELESKMQPYWDKLKSGKVLSKSDEEEFNRLIKYTTDLSGQVTETQAKLKRQQDGIKDINFEDTDTAIKKIDELKTTGEKLLSNIDSAKDKTNAAIETLRLQAAVMRDNGDMSQAAYDQACKTFDDYGKGINNGYEKDKEEIKKSLRDSVDKMNEELERKIIETSSKTTLSWWDSFIASFTKNGKEAELLKKVQEKIGDPIQTKLNEVSAIAGGQSKDLGSSLIGSIEKGINQELGDGTKIKSYGNKAAKSFSDGIVDKTGMVKTASKNMFNAMLSDEDNFCKNFAGGINNTLLNMQKSMNGISLNANGQIKYSAMPDIKIPKLATGAVIPAGAEFLAVLGDQKSGRNLEAPESLIRQIVREETAGRGDDARIVSAIERLTSVLINKKLIDSPETFAREYRPYFESDQTRAPVFGIGGVR